ncbi:predicted protein [Botrytis cinerea T4]|uniref:Uncharacterized protein n=1 Tax=Botryotinia fuckeliana (strain T4) TaxID=999810 RepID=G2Y7I8_BOTF4|nr:predicted protein [Botrytis cinerea T4]
MSFSLTSSRFPAYYQPILPFRTHALRRQTRCIEEETSSSKFWETSLENQEWRDAAIGKH